MSMSLRSAVLPIAIAMVAPAAAQTAPLTPAQTALVARARANGATDLATHPAPAGGVTLVGKLEGDQFAIAVPAGWKGDGLVYAHGYSTPGTPVAVSEDPVGAGTGGGLMRFAYEDGVAVGHSAYDKDGLGVETGTRNTKRLRDFLVKLGARRVYAAGDSMGGGIVVSLLENYPGAFAGALTRCGVVASWKTLLGQLYDMRAAYNVLTIGTPYALPGEQDIRHSALSTTPPAGSAVDAKTYGWTQLTRIATPVLALFDAAKKNPGGRETRILRQVAAIGGFDVDPGSIAFPLVTVALGADDMAATAGGLPYGNVGKVYASDTMTPAEAAAFNRDVQRVTASPAAIAYMTRWHEASGRIADPLVTMHNSIDSLVPYAQETMLSAAVKKAGNTRLLATYAVPPLRAPLPVGGVEAYTHCGFTPTQSKAAWTALRTWVDTKQRPAVDAVR
jgi:pimeloyl-ACP methyl ester carboxylesterase